MKTVLAYESMYGNTRQIAEAIAAGVKPLGKVEVVSVNTGRRRGAGASEGLGRLARRRLG